MTVRLYSVHSLFIWIKRVNNCKNKQYVLQLRLIIATFFGSQIGIHDVFYRYRADLSFMSPDARLFVSSVQQVVSVTVKKYNTPPGKCSGTRRGNWHLLKLIVTNNYIILYIEKNFFTCNQTGNYVICKHLISIQSSA